MTTPLTLLDEHGRRLFAFDCQTDPYEVLAAVSWAHPNGVSICRSGSCLNARDGGGYCVDCHTLAWSALDAARRRFPELARTVSA